MAEWTEVTRRTARTAAGHAGTLVAGALLTLLLAAWGRVEVAAFVGLTTLLVHQARGLSPSFDAHLGSVFHRVSAVVGQVVAVALLGAVHLLVIIPISAILFVLRVDIMERRTRRDRNASWRTRTEHAASPKRLFAADRRGLVPADGHGIPMGWISVALSVALVTGALWWRSSSDDEQLAAIAEAPPRYSPLDAPALDGETWVSDATEEAGRLFQGAVPDELLGYRLPDQDGRYVDVQEGVRASYQPAVPAGVEPTEVWFFGGSTMFGVHQRDDHTIPSEVARLAEDEGITLRVRNYGAMGYVNHQEVTLFESLLGAGQIPDLAVFYDGYNDLAVHFAGPLLGLSAPGSPSHALAAAFDAPDLQEAAPPDEALDAAMTLYADGLRRADQSGRAMGVDVVSFWQPDLYSKRLVPGEEVILEPLGLDAFQLAGWRDVSERARGLLPPATVDVSDALDDATGPVMTDFVHTNELGAAVVAAAIFDHLAPRLRRLAG